MIVACVTILVALQSLIAINAQSRQHSPASRASEQLALSDPGAQDLAPICDSSGAPTQNDRCDHPGCFICASSDNRDLAAFLVAATLSILQFPPVPTDAAYPLRERPFAAFPAFKGPGAPRAPPHFS